MNNRLNPAALAIVDALFDQLYAIRTEQMAAALGWSPNEPARVFERGYREANLVDQLRALGVP
jgi:hypothetical protein